MQLVEQHRIDRHDPRWKAIDAATFASKNLYNSALYVMRQQFIANHYIFPYAELDQLVSPLEQYQALPRKVAQWVLKQVCAAWTSYQAACAEYAMNPQKFKGHPKLPKYLDKQGRNLLVYTEQAISRDPKNAGWVVPSGVPIRVATKLTHDQIAQVRLVPKANHFVVEVVYDRPVAPASGDPDRIASIDIGVNNLATITANKPGFVPLLVNGRPLKSLNQGYNKRRAKLQSALPPDTFTSRLLEAMTDHRTRAISYYLHAASRAIIDLLVQEGIGTLVIGKNIGWKQDVQLGKRNNQHFVFLPHARFIDMLQYKRGSRWHHRRVGGREPHEQMLVLGSGTDWPSCPVPGQARQAGMVRFGQWAGHQCRCEWLLQHLAESLSLGVRPGHRPGKDSSANPFLARSSSGSQQAVPNGVSQRDRGCCSQPAPQSGEAEPWISIVWCTIMHQGL